jgi:hypothetical protein
MVMRLGKVRVRKNTTAERDVMHRRKFIQLSSGVIVELVS